MEEDKDFFLKLSREGKIEDVIQYYYEKKVGGLKIEDIKAKIAQIQETIPKTSIPTDPKKSPALSAADEAIFQEFFRKSAIYTKKFKNGDIIKRIAEGTPLEQSISKITLSQTKQYDSKEASAFGSKPQDGDRVHYFFFIKILLEPLAGNPEFGGKPEDDKLGLMTTVSDDYFWQHYECNISDNGTKSLKSDAKSQGCQEYWISKSNTKKEAGAKAINIGSVSDKNRLGPMSFIIDCLKSMRKGEEAAFIVPPLFFHVWEKLIASPDDEDSGIDVPISNNLTQFSQNLEDFLQITNKKSLINALKQYYSKNATDFSELQKQNMVEFKSQMMARDGKTSVLNPEADEEEESDEKYFESLKTQFAAKDLPFLSKVPPKKFLDAFSKSALKSIPEARFGLPLFPTFVFGFQIVDVFPKPKKTKSPEKKQKEEEDRKLRAQQDAYFFSNDAEPTTSNIVINSDPRLKNRKLKYPEPELQEYLDLERMLSNGDQVKNMQLFRKVNVLDEKRWKVQFDPLILDQAKWDKDTEFCKFVKRWAYSKKDQGNDFYKLQDFRNAILVYESCIRGLAVFLEKLRKTENYPRKKTVMHDQEFERLDDEVEAGKITPEEAQKQKDELEIYCKLTDEEESFRANARYWRKREILPIFSNLHLNLAKACLANRDFAKVDLPLRIVLNFEKVIDEEALKKKLKKKSYGSSKKRVISRNAPQETELDPEHRDEKSFHQLLEALYLRAKCAASKDNLQFLPESKKTLEMADGYINKRIELLEIANFEVPEELLKKRDELVKKIEDLQEDVNHRIAEDKRKKRIFWKKMFGDDENENQKKLEQESAKAEIEKEFDDEWKDQKPQNEKVEEETQEEQYYEGEGQQQQQPEEEYFEEEGYYDPQTGEFIYYDQPQPQELDAWDEAVAEAKEKEDKDKNYL